MRARNEKWQSEAPFNTRLRSDTMIADVFNTGDTLETESNTCWIVKHPLQARQGQQGVKCDLWNMKKKSER